MGRRQGCIASYTLVVVQHQMLKSSPLEREEKVETHLHLQSNLNGLWVGKAFPNAEQNGHCAGDPLPVEIKVSNVLMCCLSSGLKMFICHFFGFIYEPLLTKSHAASVCVNYYVQLIKGQPDEI